MTPTRRALLLLASAGAAVLTLASPAAAHGVTGRSDLPLPVWQAVWGAGAAVAVSFAALGVLWTRPRLAAASIGTRLPAAVDWTVRAIGVVARVAVLAVFVLTMTSALFGSEFPAANLAPITVFVTFWVGGQLVSAAFGDVWRAVSPWGTLAVVAPWLSARLRGRPLSSAEPPDEATHWPAVAAVAGFVWLELAYHAPSSPRILGLLIAGYTVVVLVAAGRFGRGWLLTGEGFGVLFGLLAHLAPFYRDVDGHLRVRFPLTGVTQVRMRRGTMVLILVVLGSTTFDGLTRTRFWSDLVQTRVGWSLTLVNTLGLLWAVGIVTLLYLASTRVMARITEEDPDEVARVFAPTLLSIVLAYSLAHYFSLFLLDGQGFWALLSDPYDRGWDLFGTAGWTVDYTLVSTTTIAWVQTGAIVVGHVAAVLAAHDRAVERYSPRVAIRSQYALLVAMVAYTVGGLSLLLGA